MTGLSSYAQHQFKKDKNGIEFNVSAPGKVILHGEHSVVYGKLAIAASLGLRTKVHLVEIDCPDVFILKILPLDFEYTFSLLEIQELLLDKSPNVITNVADFNWELPQLVNHQAHYEIVKQTVTSFFTSKRNYLDNVIINSTCCLFYLLSGILSSVDVKLKSLCITVDSELSMGAGTGSSASVSVAFSALFVHYIKLKTSNLENISKKGFKQFVFDKGDLENNTHFSQRELKAISEWSFCSEQIFHGTPSGLDNTICTYGNLVKFRKNHSTSNLTIETPIDLLLIHSTVPRETIKMVQRVADLKKTFPDVFENILDALDQLTRNVLEIIRKMDEASAAGDNEEVNKNFQLWEILIQMNHSLLSSLGVSHPKLEEINIILNKNGLKGKLTGAGGGGYSISILPPSYDPEEVIRILKEHGFLVIVTKLGGPGVKVDSLK